MLRPLFLAFTLFVAGLPVRADAFTYVHEVLPGDRLVDIARYYKTSVKKIRRRNRIRGSRLRVGKKLKIVTSRPVRPMRKVRYRVVKGDSLAKIARKHKMSTRKLARMNRKAARRLLRPGQRLWVVVKGQRPSGRRVKNLIQLSAGPGFKVRDGRRAWATFLTVTRLMDVMESYAKAFPAVPPVQVNDLSRQRGGYFYPHKSHRFGRDVDIVYPTKARYAGVVRPSRKMIDLERTWFLINEFLATKDVTYIFVDKRLQRMLYAYGLAKGEDKKKLRQILQYPRGRPGAPVRHEPGHATHLHVRFRPAHKIPPPTS